MQSIKFLFFLGLLFLLSSCTHEPFIEDEVQDRFLFNFIGHTRMVTEATVNPHLLLKDWQAEGALLLGGDLDTLTSNRESTLEAYHAIFGFDRPNTMVTLGNHDYQNLAFWENYTNRKSFYSQQLSSINVFVADTQMDLGSLVDEQKLLLETVIDTMVNSTTFILLTHKLIWMPGHPLLMDQVSDIPNGELGNCSFCTPENNFYTDIYPLLKEVQDRGIQVICLAGDLGRKISYFEFVTEDEIVFLSNGWKKDDAENEYLKFYQAEDKEVYWELVKIVE